MQSEHMVQLNQKHWTIDYRNPENEDNSLPICTFDNCFDDGIFVTISVVTTAYYQDWQSRDPYLPATKTVSDKAYVVISSSEHRISGPSMFVIGGYNDRDTALQSAYDACIAWHADSTPCTEK